MMDDDNSCHPQFYVAIDCAIFGIYEGELSLLVVRRKARPAPSIWSLTGGFTQEGENMADAIRRVIYTFTGVNRMYIEQVGAFGEMARDSEERTVSVAYYALVDSYAVGKKLMRKHKLFWFNLKKIPPLILDHNEMVKKARKIMQYKLETTPVGFNLLPELFPLTLLMDLYKAAYGKEMLTKNFRPRMHRVHFLKRTDKKSKKYSNRLAILYRYDSEAYLKNPRFTL
ncbi:MAG: NUDIX domain-containing protein [Mediterranea sp.]|jgi:ADP-ribose pyrophosphatase YjhB (NUDIX family)|nr:NUDIX domain-containing protein [Mediterranea sp.]